MSRSADLTGESDNRASLLAREVGLRMREARLQRGLSRRAFGAKLGVSAQQIHKYEIGRDTVPLHRLLVLAKMCGVSPETFWSRAEATEVLAGINAETNTSVLQLVHAYRRIGNARVRKQLLQLVKQMAGEVENSADS
jgi:transcriptional regulator with XRE-family HTH domain